MKISERNPLETFCIWHVPNLVVLTTITGMLFKTLWPAPAAPFEINGKIFKPRCVLVTNNVELKEEAKRKGWDLQLLTAADAAPLSDSVDLSSMQSKHVKFLGVLEHALSLCGATVLCVDHKIHVTTDRLRDLLSLPNPGIVITMTPLLKTSVWDEYRHSQGQPRYAKHNAATQQWLKAKFAEGYKAEARVCRTGLILYNLREAKIFNLLHEMRRALCVVQTPECQILWTILSQRYEDFISKIPWPESMQWNLPTA